MPHFAAITLDRFIKNGDSRSVNRPNQSKTTVSKVNPTNSKPWDYLRLEKTNSNSVSSTRRRDPDSPSLFPPSPHIIDHTCSIPFVVKKDDDSNLKNTIDEAKITAHEKGEGSHAVTSESSSHVWLTASDSITSVHVNGAIISECQYECINLEDGIVGEERNGPTEEDGCEMRESDSEDLCDPHNSMSSCTSHKDGEELDIQVQSSRLATLVPELPSLFPPSPHIMDHKCSTSVVVKKDDASNLKNTTDEAKISVNEKDSRSHGVPSDSSSHVLFTASDSIISGLITNECQFRCINLENGVVGEERNGLIEEDGYEMPATSTLCRGNDSEDFCDPHKSMRSCRSHKDGEELNILVQSSRLSTPTPNPDVEFYDAWEELSSVQNSAKATLEEELRDVRLSLAMETEKRKQAEESLKNMQRRWERMREHLSLVGLSLPIWKTETIDFDPSEEVICQQVHVIRFVSDSIGRGIATAEARTEMEHQLKAKNFEITRLCDRLQYYKLVNHEMSERNQQVAEEGTRCLRERRKWRQRWIWGSIGVTMSIGVVAVACRYLQPPSSCIVGALHYQPRTVNSE